MGIYDIRRRDHTDRVVDGNLKVGGAGTWSVAGAPTLPQRDLGGAKPRSQGCETPSPT